MRNPRGVHCRVATRLAALVAEYDVELEIVGRGDPVDCSSVLDVLGLGLVPGSRVCFSARGRNAHEVLIVVNELFSHTSDP